MEFYTIGVFNLTEKEFFEKLYSNNIDTFCDIRQRRAVRGSKYSFVNSTQLQKVLNEMNIKYLYEKGLAPTKEIRELQKKEDKKNGELKKNRKTLGKIFIAEYKNIIINNFNFNKLISDLEIMNSNKIVLFCVEESHNACHRSIVAEKLNNDYKFNIKNI